MEEDAANDDMVEYDFTAYEIDLDYEFDTAHFFDFCRDESSLEARQAEVWFDFAGSYPPSPFVARLILGDEMSMEDIGVSPCATDVKSMHHTEGDSDIEGVQETSVVDINYRGDVERQDNGTCTTLQVGSSQKFQNPHTNLSSGLTSYSHMVDNSTSKTETKLSKKPSFPRSSTLMKPTASQLAKQNGPFLTGHPRSNASFIEKMAKSSGSTSMVENQAAKRQKLENGLLRKVVDPMQLQTSYVHKAPNRDGLLDGNRTHSKGRNRIPRDPDLETARRALRTRSKQNKEAENVPSIPRFKALPLNRKILAAPSFLPKRSPPCLTDFQEFHLKTSERATLRSSAIPKTRVMCQQSAKASHRYTVTAERGNRELASLMNALKPEACGSSHDLKALPLNKKILRSKVDIGFYHDSKKETNVPSEFHFPIDKGCHHNPPIELFSKLSLASETQQSTNLGSQLPRSTSISTKGSKENRWGCFQQGNEIKQPSKLKLPRIEGKAAI